MRKEKSFKNLVFEKTKPIPCGKVSTYKIIAAAIGKSRVSRAVGNALNKKAGFIVSWLLVIVWMSLIFYLSNQPDLKSPYSSDVDFVLRKIAHITEFAILTFLFWHALMISAKTEERSAKKSLLPVIAFLLAFIYAISDEYHQTLIFGRAGTLKDVAIDSIGIITVSILIYKGMFDRFID